jgi:hypothetical protein
MSKKLTMHKIFIGFFLTGVFCTNGLIGQNTFIVTKTTDPDPFIHPYNFNDDSCDTEMFGTLQWAIRKSIDSLNTEPSEIHFNISGTGPHAITLDYTLPVITKRLTIDGTTQSGYLEYHPSIIIEKKDTSYSIESFYFYKCSRNIVKGLHIRKFNGSGILLNGCDSSLIQDNIITEITTGGLYLIGSSYCEIYGNLIGTDINYSDLGNSRYGIAIIRMLLCKECPYNNNNLSDNNVIGGIGNKKNIIAYNGQNSNNNFSGGILVDNLYVHELITRNKIFNNAIKAIYLLSGSPGANYNKSKPLINNITDLSNVSGTSVPGDNVELFGSTGSENANEYLTTVLTDVNGNWSANLSSSTYSYIAATATDEDNNTSELSISNRVLGSCPGCDHLRFCFPDVICAGEAITVTNGSTGCENNPDFIWNYGDNTPATDSMTHIFTSPGDYIVTLTIPQIKECEEQSVSFQIHVTDCSQPCINCIGSFSPEPGKKYIISAWVKEGNAPVTKTSYDNPQIYIEFTNQDNSITTVGPYTAKGGIIDGWQKVEEEFEIPDNTAYVKIELKSDNGDSYFDDIRVFPFDATVKSYVYDPVNLRLVSELDERNYATFYEYDEEGKLVRVKKETERGIMTIKESKNSIMKK